MPHRREKTDCKIFEVLAYQGHWTDPMKLTSTEPICSQELLNAGRRVDPRKKSRIYKSSKKKIGLTPLELLEKKIYCISLEKKIRGFTVLSPICFRNLKAGGGVVGRRTTGPKEDQRTTEEPHQRTRGGPQDKRTRGGPQNQRTTGMRKQIVEA